MVILLLLTQSFLISFLSLLCCDEFPLIYPPVEISPSTPHYFLRMFFSASASKINVRLRTGRPARLLRRVDSRILPVTYSIVLKTSESPGTVPGKIKTVKLFENAALRALHFSV